MTTYTAPIRDMRFVIESVIGLGRIQALPGQEGFTPDLIEPVLTEAARLAGEVLAPLNQSGDVEGAHFEDGAVRMPKGFAQAYKQYIDAGWNSVPFDPEYEGQGLPWLLAFAVQEMWQSANMAFGLCPLLNQGAVEAISAHGSAEQKSLYLEKLISGAWTGTMNLTEPQAGSDLAAVRTKAVRDGDHFRLTGQKIYITYGEHDLTPNIVHMVLARIEGAPEGVKGISLFLAPKFLIDADGSLGSRNDLRCLSIEHKLGIHASPTAVMSFGDNGGAEAWLIGEENRGLEYMFTMMNNARLSVGLQGVAIAERAYQQALDYARGRIQGRTLLGEATILGHPDVRRMLLHMKVLIEAGRGLTYFAASYLDIARRSTDESERSAAQARVDLLTPVVKAWCTDIGCEVAHLGVQVHGGMGYVEETGAAQHLRDALIAPIYEGTNGIQANDLVFRKTIRDKGAAAKAFVEEIYRFTEKVLENADQPIKGIALGLNSAAVNLDTTIGWIVATGTDDPASVAAGAYSYLRVFGAVAGGYIMAKAALAAADDAFGHAKRAAARYYFDTVLLQSDNLAYMARAVPNSLLAFPVDQF